LIEIRTEADAQRMISRFTPLLRMALDQVFERFSSDGETLTEQNVAEFLIKANGELGRGGTWRYTRALFEKKVERSLPPALTRQDWYGVFARELGEGKWWQVEYDLEVCGAHVRRSSGEARQQQHYQGWLDYLYFDSNSLACAGLQEALTDAEFRRIYEQGDALPNGWHPSDHLPVGAVFTWR